MPPSHMPVEIALPSALDESVSVAAALMEMAVAAEEDGALQPVHILRRWEARAGTYTYHTHVQVACADVSTFSKVVDCFFHAAALPAQPWYSQFLRGQSLSVVPAAGAIRSAICLPEFDFGLGKVHSYRQLVSEFSFANHCHVLVLRSVSADPDFPANTVVAFTLSPTGDVLRWCNGVLHWHHICTVAGVGILPAPIERQVMNMLRWLRLDHAERKTYREEAECFIRWVSDPPSVSATWDSIQHLVSLNTVSDEI
jgi:hypothetical protein